MLASGPYKTAETFIYSLAGQDWDKIQSLASGTALATIENRRKQAEKISGAKVIDFDVKVSSVSKKWALARVKAETELAGGDIDVLWYNLYLQNLGGGWKVYRAEITPPVTTGVTAVSPVNSKEIEDIKEVYSNYLFATSHKKYREAARYLVGYTRQLFETGQFIFSNNPPFEQFEIKQVKPVWYSIKDKTAVVEINSIVDGHRVNNLVTVYKTSVGWKIADIAAV
ncbi:hypothetical protein [Desulfotruncus alcoholivorax]|uniref:hypothetical protein n=1 Tax=Desulfotruncus alcoholivorax TaxID=265477 RepID=UPI0003FBB547|nr:hypothetical protein [Desulfotruncus alcoholivorax]